MSTINDPNKPIAPVDTNVDAGSGSGFMMQVRASPAALLSSILLELQGLFIKIMDMQKELQKKMEQERSAQALNQADKSKTGAWNSMGWAIGGAAAGVVGAGLNWGINAFQGKDWKDLENERGALAKQTEPLREMNDVMNVPNAAVHEEGNNIANNPDVEHLRAGRFDLMNENEMGPQDPANITRRRQAAINDWRAAAEVVPADGAVNPETAAYAAFKDGVGERFTLNTEREGTLVKRQERLSNTRAAGAQIADKGLQAFSSSFSSAGNAVKTSADAEAQLHGTASRGAEDAARDSSQAKAKAADNAEKTLQILRSVQETSTRQ